MKPVRQTWRDNNQQYNVMTELFPVFRDPLQPGHEVKNLFYFRLFPAK